MSQGGQLVHVSRHPFAWCERVKTFTFG